MIAESSTGSTLNSAFPSSAAMAATRSTLASRSLDHYAVRHPGRHPLVSKFLKEGPLNLTGHRFWDVKSNRVAVPARYASSVRDEDYESDDETYGKVTHEDDLGDGGDIDSLDSSAQNSILSIEEEGYSTPCHHLFFCFFFSFFLPVVFSDMRYTNHPITR